MKRIECGAKGDSLRGPAEVWAFVKEHPGCYAVQVKEDGVQGRLHLELDGTIRKLLGKNRKELCDRQSATLRGLKAGKGGSILVGEVETHTDAGLRVSRERGWANCIIYDALRVGRRDLTREPYKVRREALYRARSEIIEFREKGLLSYAVGSDGRARDVWGQYCEAVPMGQERFPIVAQWPLRKLDEIWSEQMGKGGEGLVLVDLNGLIGAKNAKRKVKPNLEMDARVMCVLERGPMLVRVEVCAFREKWAQDAMMQGIPIIGSPMPKVCVFSLCLSACSFVSAGDVVSFYHTGFHSTGTPMHPCKVRVRADLK